MIVINLVPENLQKKKGSRGLGSGGLGVPKETFIGVVGGVLALLLVAHVLLQFFITVKFVQHKNYSAEWDGLESDDTSAQSVIQELKKLQSKYKAVEAVTAERAVLWSQILNEISDNLPRGAWLNRIELEEDTLLIQGSAVSKQKSEMVDVHNFTSNLKKSKDFSKYFNNIELGLIKSRTISNTSVADFTIMAELK